MSIFLKGLTHDFCQKFVSSLSVIVFEKDLVMMFNNVQNGETRLSRLQKCHFNTVGKCAFFQRG